MTNKTACALRERARRERLNWGTYTPDLALPQPQVPFVVLRAVQDLEGTIPHACMATASECDGHRDREDRDQHGLPGLARAVFVCHSHTVAASSALRLPPPGDIAASTVRVADRRTIDARSLPPEEARAILGSPSCRRCYRASRRKNSPPLSNARSLRRNSVACMPLLLLPLGRGWASGGPAALGPPSRIAHSPL